MNFKIIIVKYFLKIKGNRLNVKIKTNNNIIIGPIAHLNENIVEEIKFCFTSFIMELCVMVSSLQLLLSIK